MGYKSCPERQLGNMAREWGGPFQKGSFPSDKHGISKQAGEGLLGPPEGSEAWGIRLAGDKTCTMHQRDQEGIKSTLQYILEKMCVTAALQTAEICTEHWSQRGNTEAAQEGQPHIGSGDFFWWPSRTGVWRRTKGCSVPAKRKSPTALLRLVEQMGSASTQQDLRDPLWGGHLCPPQKCTSEPLGAEVVRGA